MKKNIVLIGMPGCGKSTVGVVLAKAMGYRFADADLVIQEREDRLLSEIIEQEGLDAFLEIENRINASLDYQKTVIATGGSAIYGKEAMKHHKETGIVVYIHLPYEEIESRLGDLTKRGVAIHKGQTLRDLYNERLPMYREQADIIIETEGLTIAETVWNVRERIMQWMKEHEAHDNGKG